MLETAIATAVLMVGVVGVMSLFAVSAAMNSDFGEVATRCTEYAQDKMEQLLAIPFTNTTADTINTASNPQTDYSNASGHGTGLAVGGSVAPATPVQYYVDYFDGLGNRLAGSSTQAFYTRQWSISVDATGKVKTITVSVIAGSSIGGKYQPASTTLACYKVNLN